MSQRSGSQHRQPVTHEPLAGTKHHSASCKGAGHGVRRCCRVYAAEAEDKQLGASRVFENNLAWLPAHIKRSTHPPATITCHACQSLPSSRTIGSLCQAAAVRVTRHRKRWWVAGGKQWPHACMAQLGTQPTQPVARWGRGLGVWPSSAAAQLCAELPLPWRVGLTVTHLTERRIARACSRHQRLGGSIFSMMHA